MGRPKGIKRPPGPGVARNPLTPREIETLQMLAEGFTPRELCNGVKMRAMYKSLDRMRLKLDAFTNEEMIAAGFRKGLLK